MEMQSHDYATVRHSLQRAVENGDDAEADGLMAEIKAFEARSARPTPVSPKPATPVTTAATVAPAVRGASAELPKMSEAAAPLWRGLVCQVEAAITRRAIGDIMAARYGDLPRKAADGLGIMVKAAQNPADTLTPAWAQELTREAYGAFLQELARVSVFAALPLVNESFNGATSITIPSRDTSASTPNLAATWRKEGSPIRVGAVKLRGVKMLPFGPAILGSFTLELLQRSTPSIERVIRESVLLDSAEAFDKKFLSDDAATDVSPAGLLNGLPAGNSFASTGATPAQITADLKRALGVLLGQGLSGDGFVWIMSPMNTVALRMLISATGALQFPEMSSGRLVDLPFIASANVSNSEVYLVDAASVARSLPAPEFSVSTEGTIHEEDTTPLPIVDNAGTPVVAHPVRSLFQTYSAALRAVYNDLSWAVLRANPVVVITGVTW